MAKRLEVKTGDRYGKLTVIKEVSPRITPSGRKQRMVLVQCSCGSEPFEVALSSLRNGNTKSCGCYNKDKLKETHKKYNTYDLETYEYGVGYTTKGEEFYFDLEDYDLIKDYCWHINRRGYVVTNDNKTSKQTQVKMHRLVMNAEDGMVIDHIYHCKTDNRKSQLRICAQADNCKNASVYKNNNSGVTGVIWYKQTSKWRANISVDGKRIYLGYFSTKEDAIQARKEAEEKYFGEFAYTDNNKVVNE